MRLAALANTKGWQVRLNRLHGHMIPSSAVPGYIVQCGMRRNISSVGVRFIVQSEKSPAYLYRRLLAFVEAQGVRGRPLPW